MRGLVRGDAGTKKPPGSGDARRLEESCVGRLLAAAAEDQADAAETEEESAGGFWDGHNLSACN